MSSKRLSPEKKTSPRKKVKASPGQLILEQFFSSSNTVPNPSISVLSPDRTNNSGGESTTKRTISKITPPNDTSSSKSSPRRLLDWELSVDLDAFSTSPDLEIIDETAPNNHLASRQSALGERDFYPSTSQLTLTNSKLDDNHCTRPSSLNSLSKSISIDVTSKSSSVSYPDLAIDPSHFIVDPCPPWSPASYSFLVHALATLSNTRSRIAIINTLTNYLRCVILCHPPSLIPSLYLVTNSLAPSYLAVELGLGPSVITKALQQVSGLSAAALSKLYKSLGDPGDVAFAAKSSVRTLIPHAPLTTVNVYETMLKIARTQGQGSLKSKQKLVEKLLLSAKGEESRYLVRTLCQNLRVGAVRNSIISALARAMVFIKPSREAPESSTLDLPPHAVNKVISPDKKGNKITRSDKGKDEMAQSCLRAEGVLKHAFVIHPNLDDIAGALLDGGLNAVSERISLSVGVPLHPTLGSPARSLDEIYERLQDQAFAAELKYDGQRAQIHALQKENGEVFVKIFSRHLEDMTEKYPDVVALVHRLISRPFTSQPKLSSFIIDSEIVAVDPDTGDLKSFQDLSQRARKDVRVEDIKVSVGVYAYDMMFLNDETQIEAPFRHRRDLLYRFLPVLIPETKTVARFYHAEKCDSEEGQEAIEEFWATAVKGRAEGLMIKLLDHGELNLEDASVRSANKSRRKPLPASYEPDKRTMAWIKLKKDYVEGLGDSLDMVPIGAWHGNGRKASWWSPILLAVWDPFKEEFVAVCKCMSGFSDAFYKEMKKKYAEEGENCSMTSKWNCNAGGFSPSVYFKPSEVWEIRGSDITLSPVSIAARELISKDKGLSLRFPRFMKVRNDKNPEQASSTEFLADIWRHQENRGRKEQHVDEGDLVELDWNSGEEPTSDSEAGS